MNEVSYEVDYTPPGMGMKLSEFMRKVDLCDGVGITEIYKLTTTTNITKKYIKKMEKALKEFLEKTGGKVWSIEYQSHKLDLTK